MREINTGTLDVGSETPCPVCGADLGYYAEFGNEIECEKCQTSFAISRRTEFDYSIVKMGIDHL